MRGKQFGCIKHKQQGIKRERLQNQGEEIDKELKSNQGRGEGEVARRGQKKKEKKASRGGSSGHWALERFEDVCCPGLDHLTESGRESKYSVDM